MRMRKPPALTLEWDALPAWLAAPLVARAVPRRADELPVAQRWSMLDALAGAVRGVPGWHVEHEPAWWSGEPPAWASPARRIAFAPRLDDPGDSGERAFVADALAEVLDALTDGPTLALVDWAFAPEQRRLRSRGTGPDSLAAYAELRALRAPFLTPWCDGRRQVRHAETFAAFHLGLEPAAALLVRRAVEARGLEVTRLEGWTAPVIDPLLADEWLATDRRRNYAGAGLSDVLVPGRRAKRLAWAEVLAA